MKRILALVVIFILLQIPCLANEATATNKAAEIGDRVLNTIDLFDVFIITRDFEVSKKEDGEGKTITTSSYNFIDGASFNVNFIDDELLSCVVTIQTSDNYAVKKAGEIMLACIVSATEINQDEAMKIVQYLLDSMKVNSYGFREANLTKDGNKYTMINSGVGSLHLGVYPGFDK